MKTVTSVPESNDGSQSRQRSLRYLPPPPSSKDDLPESVRVPRVEPLPASLRSLMKGHAAEKLWIGDTGWLLCAALSILVLLAIAIAVAAYR